MCLYLSLNERAVSDENKNNFLDFQHFLHGEAEIDIARSCGRPFLRPLPLNRRPIGEARLPGFPCRLLCLFPLYRPMDGFPFPCRPPRHRVGFTGANVGGRACSLRFEVHFLQILPFCERVIGRKKHRERLCRPPLDAP